MIVMNTASFISLLVRYNLATLKQNTVYVSKITLSLLII